MGDPYSDEEIAKAKRYDPTMRPQLPSAPAGRPGADPMDLLRDKSMDADAGVGAAPPRDPYMANLPPAPPKTPMAPPVTTLTPGRQTPFSRADAQALAALDPRSLAEAKAIAAMPESTPAKITGSFGGKSFEMQPSARVDRNALARLYSQGQERRGQERTDDVRKQEQGGRERIVSIPGEQLGKRREMELATEERLAGKKIEAEAPVRAADIAAKGAQTAAVTGAEGRAQAEAARKPSPAQEALERRLEAARANPIQTAETRAQLEDLERQVLVGRGLPAEQAVAAAKGSAGPAQDPIAAIESDERLQKIIADAASKKGAWSVNPFSGFNAEGRRSGAAARELAKSAINRAAQKYGMSPEEVQQYIQSKLGG
jgi:hypothetical protein